MPDFAFAWMDCEFGGLDPELHDITEVAVILTDYRLVELASAEWKIIGRPDRISPEAAAISGYTPEGWKDAIPVRQALGAVLLDAGRPAEAEAVYRADLDEYPRNGWSLFGLSRSLAAQGRDADARWARQGFENAWARADVELAASRF